jgi:hypothetical protein
LELAVDPLDCWFEFVSSAQMTNGNWMFSVWRCVQLPRSVDFQPLYMILSIRYQNVLVRPALLAVIQLLWDRLEPSGKRCLKSTVHPSTTM